MVLLTGANNLRILGWTTILLGVLALPQSTHGAEAPPPLPLSQVLETLFNQDAARPVAPGADATLPHPPEREFLFDAVLGVEPEALLNGLAYVAARNPAPVGADAATLAARGRRVDEELQAVLEYYPLIARNEGDFLRITELIASGTQPLPARRLLLRSCMPSAQGGALSSWLRDHLADGAPPFQDALVTVLQNPLEDPKLQIEAADVIEVLISDSFGWILARSPEAQEQAAQTGQPLTIRAELDAPGSIALSKADRVRVEQQRQRAGTAAAVLEMIVRDGGRDAALREAAGAVVGRLREAYPLPRPEDVLAPPPPVAFPDGN